MQPIRPPGLWRLLLAAAAAACLLTSAPAPPAALATQESTAEQRAPRSDDGFPLPLTLSLTVVALCGAFGGLIADIVTDGGKIDRPARTATGWLLGAPGKVLVGAAAALITLPLNPPDGAWATLIGMAVGAGVGGEALLLAFISKRQADAAAQERDQARERARALARTSLEQIDAVRQALLASYRGGAAAAAAPDTFEAHVNTAFAQARRAVTALIGAPASIWEQVHTLIARRVGRRDLDGRPLGDLADDRVRHQIADDIDAQWPSLTPRWTAEDLPPDTTLESIVDEIDRRTL